MSIRVMPHIMHGMQEGNNVKYRENTHNVPGANSPVNAYRHCGIGDLVCQSLEGVVELPCMVSEGVEGS